MKEVVGRFFLFLRHIKWVIIYFPYLLIYYMQLLEKKGVARICRLQ